MHHTPEEVQAIAATASAFLLGFSTACAAFVYSKAVRQTYVIWHRIQKPTAYMIMVWIELLACFVMSLVNYLFLDGHIRDGCVTPSDAGLSVTWLPC
jgi:prepilin-type processing-associated H-X9-DG protein